MTRELSLRYTIGFLPGHVASQLVALTASIRFTLIDRGSVRDFGHFIHCIAAIKFSIGRRLRPSYMRNSKKMQIPTSLQLLPPDSSFTPELWDGMEGP